MNTVTVYTIILPNHQQRPVLFSYPEVMPREWSKERDMLGCAKNQTIIDAVKEVLASTKNAYWRKSYQETISLFQSMIDKTMEKHRQLDEWAAITNQRKQPAVNG